MSEPESAEDREDAKEPEAPADKQRARSEAPPSSHEFDARGFDRILPELLRRGLLAGKGPLEKVGESFFPRELTATLVSQLGDLRGGVVKAVAHEVGRFLREADIASELSRVLAGLEVEANVRLRFRQRKDGSLEADLTTESEPDARTTSSKPKAERSDKPERREK